MQQVLRQLGGGLLLGLLSVVIIIGAMSLALAEMDSPQPTSPPTLPTLSLPSITPSSTALIPATAAPLSSPTNTAVSIPPASCPVPSGWFLITIQAADTLDGIATRYHTTSTALASGNCLASASLQPGRGLYVPPIPQNTAVPCGAPYGWVQYIIQPGDTLYHISQLYRITVPELKHANCLTSDIITLGGKLWVPNTGTSTPNATPINIEFDTVTPEPSSTSTATATSTVTATSTSTATSTATPTSTPPTPPAQ
jgi:LysM repeat protein